MTLPTDEQLCRDFRRILEQRADIGATKIFANWLFEPPHIFDPHCRRKLKPEFVLVLAYFVLMALACTAFNFG